MTRSLIAYLVTLLVMVTLDLLWLGLIAKPVYQQGIGHLMAERPNLTVALLFYAVYAVGLVVFAVLPHAADAGWAKAAFAGALFGFFAYATYDLTNLATLKGWPVGVSLLDMAWGSTVSAAASVAGKLALDRWGPAAG
jgi:uncharacterized membrane protein